MSRSIRARKGVSALLAAATLAGAASTWAQGFDYRGRVREKAMLRMVAGATVKLDGTGLSVTTDSAGRFRLTGSVGVAGTPGIQAWSLDGETLRLAPSNRARTVSMEYFAGNGSLVSRLSHPIAAGSGGALRLEPGSREFAGMLRVSAGGQVLAFRVVSAAGVLVASPLGRASSRLPGAAAKPAAAGITISMAGLVTKTLAPAENSVDLGDIILEYPPRKPGVGAAMPYGSHVLLPAGGDSASFRAWFEKDWIHKMNSWRQGQGLGTTPLLWKVMTDPEAAAGTFKGSLQPCCLPRNGSQGWGYDDIITKKTFKDYQVHVEFNMMGLPDGNTNTSGYCNSGIFLTNNHEVQVETPKANPSNYERLHGMGTLLDFKVPDKDMYPGAGKWQAYDITFRAPRSGEQGRVTVYWNGERVHNNVSWGSGNGNPVGFALQNELGSDVRYRNIWIKELDIQAPATDFGF